MTGGDASPIGAILSAVAGGSAGVLLLGMSFAAVCVGAGLYLRGFWVYFRTIWWLRQPEQSELRRRYRSSALAVLLREPGMAAARRQVLMSGVGVVVFVLGGSVFNALWR